MGKEINKGLHPFLSGIETFGDIWFRNWVTLALLLKGLASCLLLFLFSSVFFLGFSTPAGWLWYGLRKRKNRLNKKRGKGKL